MVSDVTVVMPAMNRAHMIGPALDSAWRQTDPPRAVVVIDDGSSDGTADVARRHGAQVIELAVNGGSGPARNRGIESAESEWIAFLDSDDMWMPDHLERVLARASDDIVLITSPARVPSGGCEGNSRGREVALSPLRALTLDLICTSGTIVRRDSLIRAGLFRDLRRAQDMDLWVRVLEEGPGVALAAPTVIYQTHEQQATTDSELVYACVDRIIAACKQRPWFRRGDEARALVRRRWDFARHAQRERRIGGVVRHLGWVVARPYTWATLGAVLAQRRTARRGDRKARQPQSDATARS